ncbi:Uncharacterised protein [Mycobacteroides abscessus subsp. abscessus]|nr:Uncharacterised protein [Mycobacteroides abscessus subsp. abscessus]
MMKVSFSRVSRWMPKQPSAGAHRYFLASQEVSANSSSAKRLPASSTPTR